MQKRQLLCALCLISLGFAAACTNDPTYEVDMGDRSDDLAGREINIAAADGERIVAGLHTANIALVEREDNSLTIYPDAFTVDPNYSDFEVKQPSSWISFETTLYGFVFGYRTLGSNDEWTPVSDDNSLANFTIFESAAITMVSGRYEVRGTGINFDDIEFDNNTTAPAGRFNEFDAVASGLPNAFEMRIFPIPVFNFGDFESSYEVDFEVTVLGQ